jgi:hypothetical protein
MKKLITLSLFFALFIKTNFTAAATLPLSFAIGTLGCLTAFIQNKKLEYNKELEQKKLEYNKELEFKTWKELENRQLDIKNKKVNNETIFFASYAAFLLSIGAVAAWQMIYETLHPNNKENPKDVKQNNDVSKK